MGWSQGGERGGWQYLQKPVTKDQTRNQKCRHVMGAPTVHAGAAACRHGGGRTYLAAAVADVVWATIEIVVGGTALGARIPLSWSCPVRRSLTSFAFVCRRLPLVAVRSSTHVGLLLLPRALFVSISTGISCQPAMPSLKRNAQPRTIPLHVLHTLLSLLRCQLLRRGWVRHGVTHFFRFLLFSGVGDLEKKLPSPPPHKGSSCPASPLSRLLRLINIHARKKNTCECMQMRT
jgi:hypothetical protein